jgi:hypothetical protein
MPMLEPKAQTPTVIDTNAPFACKITCQSLQTIERRHAQVIDFDRRVKLRVTHHRPLEDLRGRRRDLPDANRRSVSSLAKLSIMRPL